MDNTAPITQDEMIQMFGEAMPIEAVNLIWDAPEGKTVAEVRAELRKIAANKRPLGMIERVAKTICDLQHGHGAFDAHSHLRDHFFFIGRAAIESMREPTEAMINDEFARCYNYGPFGDKEVRRIFSAMIDAAIRPPLAHGEASEVATDFSADEANSVGR